MKKSLIAALLILTVFSLIIHQKYGDTLNDQNAVSSISSNTQNNSSTDDLVLTETSGTELSESVDNQVAEETDKKIHKMGSQEDDAVSFDPKTLYYNNDGELVVTGNIVNLKDHSVGIIRIKKIEIYNEHDELIAKNSIGYIDNLILRPGEESEWNYIFPAITVAIKDDDLEFVKAITTSSSAGY